MATAPGSVRGVLVRYGIFLLSPGRQTALAECIETLGINAEQVAALASYVFDQEPDEVKAKRYLAALLSDTTALQEALKNLGIHLTTKPAKEPKRYPGESLWAHPAKAELDDDRKCRMAYCLIVHDRKDLDYVAEVLGVDKGEIPALVERGEQKQRSAFLLPKTSAEVKESRKLADRKLNEHRERVAEFRRRA